MRIVIIGPGRVGTTVAARLRERGHQIVLTRDPAGAAEADCVLLAVPDDAIDSCAGEIGRPPFVGMFSGSVPLDRLPRRGAFVLHPVMTVTREGGPAQLEGAPACVTATDAEAEATARTLAGDLGLVALTIPEAIRPLPHVAAVLAANYLAAPLAASARVLGAVGLEPGLVAPLARRALEHALAAGAEAAPTGPIARGDASTVQRHLIALRRHAPELEGLYRALGAATLPLVDSAAAARVAPLLAAGAAA